ncbi:trypsin-like serine peptidase [Streptomyces gamaensis]|uniref:Trypsin-like serine peptidase n=1 Tax=Streptomyces gamaensis TaxID=1763542 RepID=A0ABW0YZF6_9ACTN
MIRNAARKTTVLAVGVALGIGCVTPAVADPAPDDGVLEHAGARTAADRQRVQDYWTAEKMKMVTRAGDAPDPVGKDADDLPGQDRTRPSSGAVWGGGGLVRKTVGRLFMTSYFKDESGKLQADDRSCTGTVVEGTAGSTVVTAAHCVLSGDRGDQAVWDTNVYFVPGYRDGAKPLGGFTVNTTFIPADYKEKLSPGSDVAMLAMNPAADGRKISEITGTQKIRFGAQRGQGQFTYDFGYSAEGYGKEEPWRTGQLLGYCAGPAAKDDTHPEWNHWGVRCDMYRGSSGGPHFVDFDAKSGSGTVVGVNSNMNRKDGKTFEFAAPLGEAARKLYLRAQEPAR